VKQKFYGLPMFDPALCQGTLDRAGYLQEFFQILAIIPFSIILDEKPSYDIMESVKSVASQQTHFFLKSSILSKGFRIMAVLFAFHP